MKVLRDLPNWCFSGSRWPFVILCMVRKEKISEAHIRRPVYRYYPIPTLYFTFVNNPSFPISQSSFSLLFTEQKSPAQRA
ncbi:hypothetical protein I7I50_08522 [Histoplasma capsulatum G186AR]|uniref:Uncharacterized protein n=1 Tax=Ajellomyces capsulatus TaxID=5037 RepID=A0A8H7YU55_AJECA|nr:hypothetical protein I7I52_06037 [Histoplasma capsulatum]QSS73660.1 hypothetical protein I7I50_08522 [Histoplasma capsulatum G186AR]